MGILTVTLAATAVLVFLALRANQMNASVAREPVAMAKVGIPPIDANQPAKIETATFAEG